MVAALVVLLLASLAALLVGAIQMHRDRERLSSPYIMLGCAGNVALSLLHRTPGWQVDLTFSMMLLILHVTLYAWERRRA